VLRKIKNYANEKLLLKGSPVPTISLIWFFANDLNLIFIPVAHKNDCLHKYHYNGGN